MNTTEQLLLCAGQLLPQHVRDRVNAITAVGLKSMLKGVQLPAFSSDVFQVSQGVKDRKIKRTPCEIIRSHSYLQISFLQLCATNALSVQSDGTCGNNITLLKRACELCMHQSEIALISQRILLSLESVLFPSSLALPPVTIVTDIVNRGISEHRAHLQEDKLRSENSTLLTSYDENNSTKRNATFDSEYAASESSSSLRAFAETSRESQANFGGQNKKAKISSNANPSGISTASSLPVDEKVQINSAKASAVVSQNNNNVKSVAGKAITNMESDDEGSLPDIDIS